MMRKAGAANRRVELGAPSESAFITFTVCASGSSGSVFPRIFFFFNTALVLKYLPIIDRSHGKFLEVGEEDNT